MMQGLIQFLAGVAKPRNANPVELISMPCGTSDYASRVATLSPFWFLPQHQINIEDFMQRFGKKPVDQAAPRLPITQASQKMLGNPPKRCQTPIRRLGV